MAQDCSRRSARCSSRPLRFGRRPRTACQGPRSLVRVGRTVVTFRGRLGGFLVASAVVAGLLAGGGAAGVLLPTGTAATAMRLVWAAFTLRVIRLTPACSSPGGDSGPGGAGVREPRRPKPFPPAGAIALPLPQVPPDGTAALA